MCLRGEAQAMIVTAEGGYGDNVGQRFEQTEIWNACEVRAKIKGI